MASKRKTLSKKTRFEVFKRDGFKCQYCGATAPEAVLVVDHIHPLSQDGDDSILNYITACQPCNAGKSDRLLSDDSAVAKQRAQLDDLNARREQLEMMLQWREGLRVIDDFQISVIEDAWKTAASGWHLSETGIKGARGYLKKHGLQAVLDAIEVAERSYIVKDADGKATATSVDLAWKRVGGILTVASLPVDKQRLHYVKGILRNRLSYVPYDVVKVLGYALDDGVPLHELEDEAKSTRSWNAYCLWLVEAREAARGN